MKKKLVYLLIIILVYFLFTSTLITASDLPFPINTITKSSANVKTQNILEKLGIEEDIISSTRSKYFRPVSDAGYHEGYGKRQPIWPSWELNTQNYFLVIQGQTGNLLRLEIKIDHDKDEYLVSNSTPELSEENAKDKADSLMKIMHPNVNYELIEFARIEPPNENYMLKYIFRYQYDFPWTLMGFISRDGSKNFKYEYVLVTTPNGRIISSSLVRIPIL